MFIVVFVEPGTRHEWADEFALHTVQTALKRLQLQGTKIALKIEPKQEEAVTRRDDPEERLRDRGTESQRTTHAAAWDRAPPRTRRHKKWASVNVKNEFVRRRYL